MSYLINYAISIVDYVDNLRPILSNSKVQVTYIINYVNMITDYVEIKMFNSNDHLIHHAINIIDHVDNSRSTLSHSKVIGT